MAELPDASNRLLAGFPQLQIQEFPEGTKTAEDAARAIGCPVAAIVKSLVFVVSNPDRPVVALVPGDKRLSLNRLATAAGAESARRATLEEVREATGYAAGGTPPFGHANPLEVFADPQMKRHDPVWAAAGTPTTVFPIGIGELDRLASPIWAEIVED